jgi:hypothetical protein
MKVPVKVYLISVQPLSYMGCQGSNKGKFSTFKKQNALLLGKAFLLLYFLRYAEETII